MRQLKPYRFSMGVVVIAVCVVFGIYLVTSSVTSRHIASPIKEQLIALRSGDLPLAYTFISQKSQSTSSLRQFKDFIRTHTALLNNKEMSLVSENAGTDSSTIKVLLTSNNGVVTPATYRLVNEDGKWRISYITLSPKETIEPPVEVLSASAQPADTQQVPATQNSSSVMLPQVYESERYSFTIHYPDSWEYTLPNNKSILFTTKNAPGQFAPTLAIRPILHQDTRGKYHSVNSLLSMVTRNLNNKATDINLLERGRVNLTPSAGEKLDGRYVIISYVYQGQAYKQMEVIYYMTEDRALYALEYQAPAQTFDASLPIAKAMVKSFVFE